MAAKGIRQIIVSLFSLNGILLNIPDWRVGLLVDVCWSMGAASVLSAALCPPHVCVSKVFGQINTLHSLDLADIRLKRGIGIEEFPQLLKSNTKSHVLEIKAKQLNFLHFGHVS